MSISNRWGANKFCLRCRASGFTLIELLVVVMVIAILATMLMPSVFSAMKSAQSARCMSNLRQFGQAHTMYMENNFGYLAACGPPYAGYPYWYVSLARYLKDDKVYRCPGGVGSGNGYGMNNRFINAGDGAQSFEPSDMGIWGRTETFNVVTNAGATIVFADAAPVLNPTAEPEAWEESATGNTAAYMHFPQTPAFWAGHATGDNQRAMPRHKGAVNCCFFDAHVEAYKIGDIIGAMRYEGGCLYDNQ